MHTTDVHLNPVSQRTWAVPIIETQRQMTFSEKKKVIYF